LIRKEGTCVRVSFIRLILKLTNWTMSGPEGSLASPSTQDAGEIMGSVPVAMIAGLPYTALREAILTPPTLIEGA